MPPHTSIRRIEDLTPTHLENLTRLLSIHPSFQIDDTWLADQAQCLSSFPPLLKRSSSIFSKIKLSLPSLSNSTAFLCPVHKPLNPYLIRQLFLRLSTEVTTRIARLVSNPYLPPEVQNHVHRMQTLNSLWLSPDLYRVAYNASPYDLRYERVESGCEACILASIGGNPSIIRDLRASIMGRKLKRKKRLPRLLPVIEAWTDWMGTSEELRAESDSLGKEIRVVRRQMQLARRQLRRNKKDGIVEGEELLPFAGDRSGIQAPNPFDDQEHEREGDAGSDQENEIIDFYANMPLSGNLASPGTAPCEFSEADIHPMLRNSIVFSPTTGAFHRSVAGGRNSVRPPPPPDVQGEPILPSGRYEDPPSSSHPLDPISSAHIAARQPPPLPPNAYVFPSSSSIATSLVPKPLHPASHTRSTTLYSESVYSRDEERAKYDTDEYGKAYRAMMHGISEDKEEDEGTDRRPPARMKQWDDFS